MNRHNPTISRSTIGAGLARIYEQGNSARSIPAVIENHGAAAIRLVFTETGSAPDPDAFVSLAAGSALECNPDTDIWAYSPSGASCEVAVVTGVRHVGGIGASSSAAESGSVVSDAAAQMALLNGQKQLLAELVVMSKVIMRYLAEWQGEEFKQTDAVKM